jgi:hypothetical protein
LKIIKKLFSSTGLILAATLLLGACGEEATSTSSASTTTAAATIATATTAATTTVAATTANTTSGAVATTSAASSVTSGTDNTVLPAITGTTEVQTDATIRTEVAKQLGIPTLNVKLFTSDEEAAKLGEATDAALTKSGYAFGIPGLAKPLTQNGGTVGLYSRSGSSDILFTAVAIPENTTDVSKNIPGIDPATAQKFADQIKGKKTLLIVMTGPDLLQALIKLGQSSGTATGTAAAAAGATPTVASATIASGTPAAASTTSAATTGTTAAAATSATGTTSAASNVGSLSGAEVIAYTGSTGIVLPDVLKNTLLSGLSTAKNSRLDGFKSSDAPATVKTGLASGYTQSGWTDATASFEGASAALSQLGPDAFFIAYTKDNKVSFVLGLSGATASLLGVSGVEAGGTVYIIGSGER